jgi:predicted anti-sigma-YlaC factor YlaD
MTQWLMKSDVAAALTGALFKHGFSQFPGSMGMVSAQAGVYSVLARVLPGSVNVSVGNLSAAQKNEIAVGVLGALGAMYHKHDPFQGAVGYMCVDALSLQLMEILGMADGSLLGGAAP